MSKSLEPQHLAAASFLERNGPENVCPLSILSCAFWRVSILIRQEPTEAGHSKIQNAALRRLRNSGLKWHSGRCVDDLAAECRVSVTTALRYLQSTAEVSRRGQDQLLADVCKYVQTMSHSLRPLAFVFHEMYDETPLRLRVCFDPELGHEGQLAKTWVILCHWSMVLQITGGFGFDGRSPFHPANFLCIEGRWAPAVRASNSTNAHGTAGILQSSPKPDPGVFSIFQKVIRVSETDELSANLKGDRLFQASFAAASPRTASSLHWICTAHKCHSVTEKLFGLHAHTLSSIVSALLAVQNSQQLGRLRSRIETVVRSQLQLKPPVTLSRAAKQFRSNILHLFTPPGKYGKKRSATLSLALVLNGDWRCKSELHHHCEDSDGVSKELVIQKVTSAVLVAVKALRPGSSICKANWIDWARPFDFVGLLANVHSLLRDSYVAAFSTSQTLVQAEPRLQ